MEGYSPFPERTSCLQLKKGLRCYGEECILVTADHSQKHHFISLPLSRKVSFKTQTSGKTGECQYYTVVKMLPQATLLFTVYSICQ